MIRLILRRVKYPNLRNTGVTGPTIIIKFIFNAMTFYLGAFFTLHRVTRCSPRLVNRFWSASWTGETPCAQFGLLSHGIFQDDFRCLIGSLVALAVKLHRNAPHCVSLISLIAGRYVVFIVVLGGIMKQNVKWCNYILHIFLFSHFNVYCFAGAHF